MRLVLSVGLGASFCVGLILAGLGEKNNREFRNEVFPCSISAPGFAYQNQTQVAAELDASGKVVKRFIYGSKGNVPDYMIVNGKNYLIVSDQVGTPQMVIDAADGRVVEETDFDEFGVSEHPEKNHLLPFGFAGGIQDWDTGLVHFGAREYDPQVGRWLSKDPLLFNGDSANLYGYTVNDPVNFVDPTGLSGIGITGGGSVETGIGTGGTASQTGSGFGYFGGGSESGWGGFTYSGWYSSNPGNYVYGLSGGVGSGVFYTNANSPSQLAGFFNTTTYNLFLFTISIGKSGDTSIYSLSGGKGWGLSTSSYPVNTTTTWGVGCP